MRAFYLAWPDILQTASAMSAIAAPTAQKLQAAPAVSETALPAAPSRAAVGGRFPLPWSAYVRLPSVGQDAARKFYETEALRGGWSVRQLDRQINSLFYERVALSRNKASMLTKGSVAKPQDVVAPEDAIKDSYVLEFLELKDEYSENQLETALIERLETFLLELGGDFAFIGSQRRLRIDDQWFRVDLLLFNRRLRCLVVIDLKIGSFTHADAGQMHVYLNYAREHWALPGENPPVGLILCASEGTAQRTTRWRAYRTRCWRRNTGWPSPTKRCSAPSWTGRDNGTPPQNPAASDNASCNPTSSRYSIALKLAPARTSSKNVSVCCRENTRKTGRPCWARTNDQRIMSPLL